MRIHRVFMSLFRELMSRQIVALTMGCCRRTVGMGCEVVQFCCSIMCTLGHRILLMERVQDMTDRVSTFRIPIPHARVRLPGLPADRAEKARQSLLMQ